MRISKIVLLVFSILAFTILTGCANTAAVRTERGLELDLTAKSDEGFVVLKVISTRPISLINPKWQSVKVSSNGKLVELDDITPPYNMLMGQHFPTESLHFAKLQAGSYDVTGLGSIGPVAAGLLLALLASDHAAAGGQLPSFKVDAGRLANLGTIVYAPEIDKEQPERIFLLHGPAGKRAAYDALLGEAKLGDLSLPEGGGWANAASAEAEAAVLAQVRPLVSMLNIRNTNSGLIAGSHLGQVFRRTGPQTWTREYLNTLGTVFSIAHRIDGRLIAGSDYGRYFVKDSIGVWKAYRLGQETGRVSHIEEGADGSVIFVISDVKQNRVLLKKSLENVSEVATEITTVAAPHNVLGTEKEVFIARNVLSMARETEITRIEKQSLAVTSSSEKFWVREWQYLPDGKVMLTRQNGMSLYKSSSFDNMKTWTHSELPGLFSSYWFDENRAIALDWSTGFTMVTNLLRRTRDGGKSWEPFGNSLESRHAPGRIVYADDSEILLQGSHMLYSTIDQGQTWQRLFTPRLKN
jgi:photosystem II stability/assembly factor-like uncharacterized protein